MSEIIIGIDLGTTNSEVAYVKDGQVTVIEIQDGNCLLPSIVGIADDGSILVGDTAANQSALYPERTVKSIKRQMGTDYQVMLGGQVYTPQEISAIILKRLKTIAETHLGEPVQKAVITVPAFFSDAQRQATRDAGAIAGLEVSRIINEPTAAALAYESNHQGQKNILVYDLGGGTFDVSVVRLEDDVVEVLASHGDNHLGGDDFDQAIINFAVDHLKNDFSVTDAELSLQVMARIRRAAEFAKISLSDNPFARLDEEYLLNAKGKVVHLSLELSRGNYEDMIAPLIDQTLQAVHTALDGANLSVSDIDEILLVGGATRTPLVSQRLEQEVGLQPRSEVNPDLCVANGAAIQGAVISGEKVNSVLVDITPFTFGTSALAEVNGELYPFKFIPIIRKNSAIPICKTDVFYTAIDNQTSVEVMVFQGEDEDALNNTEIGKFLVDGLSKVPASNEILATFSLDLDGILKVSAMEKRTGLEANITINNAFDHFEEAQMAQAKERIGQLFDTELVDETTSSDASSRRNETKNKALIDKAEKLLDIASEDDSEDLVDGIECLKDAIAQGGDIEDASDQLSDLIFYLES